MVDQRLQPGTEIKSEAPATFRARVLGWAFAVWRPAGTAIAVLLALLVTWHVIHGKHGLSVWQQERAQDRIVRKAREELHYARPGEVIYTLPASEQKPAQPDAAGK